MPTNRRTTAALAATALAAAGVVLSAGTAAAQTAPNPDLRNFTTGPSCAAKTFTGSVRASVVASALPKGSRPQLVVQLRWNAGGTAYEDTAVAGTQTTWMQAGTGDYPFSIDTSRVPANAKNLMAYAIAYPDPAKPAAETLQSRVLAASFCAAAPSSTKISRVSIDCSGDVVTGEATLVDPPSSGSVPASVSLQGKATGATAWSTLGTKASTVTSETTSLPYTFSITGKHTHEYRIRATVNNGTAVLSEMVPDATCAPPAEVPEAPAALLLPLSMAAGAGAVVVARRRRAALVPASS